MAASKKVFGASSTFSPHVIENPRKVLPFGHLYKPRTLSSKRRHLQVLENIPFDMVAAVRERQSSLRHAIEISKKARRYKIGVGYESVTSSKLRHRYPKGYLLGTRFTNSVRDSVLRKQQTTGPDESTIPPQFLKVLTRYRKSPVDELIASLMKAVIVASQHAQNVKEKPKRQPLTEFTTIGKSDSEQNDIWNAFSNQIRSLIGQMNSADIGLILRCIVKLSVSGSLPSYSTQIHDDSRGSDYILTESTSSTPKCICKDLLLRLTARRQPFSYWAITYSFGAITHFNIVDIPSVFLKLLSQISRSLPQLRIEDISRIVNTLSQVPTTRVLVSAPTDSTSLYAESSVSATFRDIVTALLSRQYLLCCAQGSDQKDHWSCASVYMIANGMSRKGLHDKKLFDVLGKKFLEMRADFTNDGLTALANAFGKFGSAEENGFIDIFVAIAEEIIKIGEKLHIRNICIAANAFCQASVLHEELFHTFSQVIPGLVNSCDGRQLSLLAHAYVRLGLAKDPLLHVIWQHVSKIVMNYNWQGISLILQSYTKSGGCDVLLLHKISDYLLAVFQSFYPKYFERPFPDRVSCSNVERFLLCSSSLDTGDLSRSALKALPDSSSLSCIGYSLVKGHHLHCGPLYAYLSRACQREIHKFRGSEIANLCFVFSEVFTFAQTALENNDILIKGLQTSCLTNCTSDSACKDAKKEFLLKKLDSKGSMPTYISSEDSRITMAFCHEFFDACLQQLKHMSGFSKDVGLMELLKIICGFSALRKIESGATLASLLKQRASELPSLSYVPLGKLIGSLVALNIHDDDLLGALAAAQQKRKKRNDETYRQRIT